MREPTSAEQLQEAAEAVLSMMKTIRQYLPVQGDVGSKSHPNVIDSWLERAGEAYASFERIRNPDKLPWPGPRGSFYVVVPSRAASAEWQELCYAVEPVVEHYGWQGISDESTISGPYCFRGGRPAPPIDAAILDRVETAASGLLAELTAAENAGRRILRFSDHSNDALAVTVTTGNPAVATAGGDARDNTPATKPDGTEKPNRYLIGWNEILDKLGLADEKKEYLRTLNERHGGPIIITQGAHPKVDESELVAWWNGLREIWKAAADTLKADEERHRDAKATIENVHGYGGDDQSVVPEIRGGVKRRSGGRNAK
jgi:hypothetical protein